MNVRRQDRVAMGDMPLPPTIMQVAAVDLIGPFVASSNNNKGKKTWRICDCMQHGAPQSSYKINGLIHCTIMATAQDLLPIIRQVIREEITPRLDSWNRK